jgi:hypothetical protein
MEYRKRPESNIKSYSFFQKKSIVGGKMKHPEVREEKGRCQE